MLIRSFHRFVLFAVGLTIFTETVTIIPGWVGLNKPITALLVGSALLMLAFRSARFPRNPLHYWVLAMLFSVLLGLAVGFVQGAPPDLLARMGQSYVLVIAFYFLVVVSLPTVSELRSLLWGVMLGGFVTSLTVIAGFGTAGIETVERTGGLAKDPNYFAIGAAVSIAIAVVLALSSRRRSTQILLVGASGIMVWAIVSSLSRGGYLAFGVMALFFVHRFIGFRRVGVLIPLLIVAAVIPAFLPESVIERATVFRNQGVLDSSIQNRLDQYQRSLELFSSSPVWGVGLGRSGLSEAFGGAVKRQDLRGLSARRRGHSVIHNSYLVVAAEFGLIGLIAFLGTITLSWLGFSRVIRSQRWIPESEMTDDYRLLINGAKMMQIALLGVLVASIFLDAGRFKAIWMLFALSPVLVSMASAYVVNASEQTVERQSVGTPETSPAT
jgi:O-antigen ligase